MKILVLCIILSNVLYDYGGLYNTNLGNFLAYAKDTALEPVRTLKKNSISGQVYGNNQEYQLDEFDYIVIGAGSAGPVLAARLSESNSHNSTRQAPRVLLLEAGERENLFSRMPVIAPVLQVTDYAWDFPTEPQEGCCTGMEAGRCSWRRGKALGGCTAINYMVYSRGIPLDYDKWSNEGNKGWSYEEVFPYLQKLENCKLGKVCNSSYRHRGGPVSVEWPYTTELADIFIQAGSKLGSRKVEYNTPDYLGFSKPQATLKGGRRGSTATSYLDPIANRVNLKVLTSATVTKILIDPVTKEATGVEFYRRNVKYTAKARREVISSAGTIKSPQLLMLSGIGPREELEKHNITVIEDLPVGQTLYDHVSFMGFLVKTNKSFMPHETFLNPMVYLDWLVKGEGAISSLSGVEALAFINTKGNTDYTDVELVLSVIGSLQYDYGIISTQILGVRRDLYDQFFKPLEETPTFAIFPTLLHPKSSGKVKLRSKDPFDGPLLYANYYQDKEDIETMVRSIRYIQNLIKTEPFQRIGAKMYETPLPGCDNHTFDSDGYWECCLRSLSTTLYHPIASCKMGNDTATSVVDNEGKVHGIKRLRVADSSIIPTTISGHTNVPTIMIGEKIADIIRNEYEKGR